MMRPLFCRVRLLACLALLLGALPLLAAPVGATGRCVAPGGAGSCFATLAAAIAASADGDTISVAAGTYSEHDILVNKSVTITGAGSATTTVDGAYLGRVLTVPAGKAVALSGMTITRGYPHRGNSGGAILNQGTLTLTGAAVTASYASNRVVQGVGVTPAYGGGIYSDTNSTLTLNGVIVSGNTAKTPPFDGPDQDGGQGGGIATRGTLTIQGGSTISGNSGVSNGGGIVILDDTQSVVIRDTAITANETDTSDAAIATNIFATPEFPVTLDHVTINDNGLARPSAANTVTLGPVSLTMTSTTITHNRGRGINWQGRVLAVSDSAITLNVGPGSGGGRFDAGQGEGTITRTLVSGNEATDNNNVGGLQVNGVTISDSQITGNNGYYGGLLGGSVNNALINSVVSGNQARGTSARTGGVSTIGTITNSTISNNSTTGIYVANAVTDVAGGVYSAVGTGIARPVITGSTICGNSAPSGGVGGIVLHLSATIANSTICNNTGDGIRTDSRGIGTTITNTTIAGNGTGIANPGTGSQADPITLRNSIVANTGANCTTDFIESGGYNVFSDASCTHAVGTDLTGTNPQLNSLANNGGPTQTISLKSSSPAIDRVPASGANCPATDQRGVARPAGAGCEVGAFEFKVDAAPALRPGVPPVGNPPPQPVQRPQGQPAGSVPNPAPQPRP